MTDEARIADGLGGLTQWSSVLSWAELYLNLGDGGIGWRILALSKTPIFRRKDTP